MKIVPGEQLSGAWLQAHRGCVSGSYMKAVLDFTMKGAPGSTRTTYLKVKIAEMLTARVESDNYVSREMLDGLEREPAAKTAYQLEEDVLLEEVGFALHDGIPRFGGSLDGLVGDYGFVEIKCPKPGTHQAWIRSRAVPPQHLAQINSYFSISGRAWCDFVTFCPLVPKPMQVMTIRVPRDENAVAKIEAAVWKFNAEVDAAIEELRSIVGPFELPASMDPESLADKPVDQEWERAGITGDDIEWAKENL